MYIYMMYVFTLTFINTKTRIFTLQLWVYRPTPPPKRKVRKVGKKGGGEPNLS